MKSYFASTYVHIQMKNSHRFPKTTPTCHTYPQVGPHTSICQAIQTSRFPPKRIQKPPPTKQPSPTFNKPHLPKSLNLITLHLKVEIRYNLGNRSSKLSFPNQISSQNLTFIGTTTSPFPNKRKTNQKKCHDCSAWKYTYIPASKGGIFTIKTSDKICQTSIKMTHTWNKEYLSKKPSDSDSNHHLHFAKWGKFNHSLDLKITFQLT